MVERNISQVITYVDNEHLTRMPHPKKIKNAVYNTYDNFSLEPHVF